VISEGPFIQPGVEVIVANISGNEVIVREIT